MSTLPESVPCRDCEMLRREVERLRNEALRLETEGLACVSDIRDALGCGYGPTLSELPKLVRELKEKAKG